MSKNNPEIEEKLIVAQIEKLWIKAKRNQTTFNALMPEFMAGHPERSFSVHFFSSKNKVSVMIRRAADHPNLRWYWYTFKFSAQ